MMKFKKFLAAAMTGAMMLGVVAAATPAVTAYAAAPTVKAIDYANFEIEVTPASGEKIVYLEVLKENDEKAAVSATYSFVITAATKIDLSFLKAAKEQYIRFYGVTGEKTSIIVVAAQAPKFSVKFTLKDTVANSFVGKGFDASKVASDYEYKGLYASTWKDMKDLTLDMLKNYSVTGTTLNIRAKAVDHPASAEVKVKVAAAPKAPKVTIDYVKSLVSTAKGVEYTTDPTAAKWTAMTETKVDVATFCKAADSTYDGTKDLTVYLRTAATDKKAASNIYKLTIPKNATFASGAKFDEAATKALNGSIAMADKAEHKVEAKTTIDTRDPAKVTVVFTTAGASFDFSIDDGKTWKTVAAGKTFVVDQTLDGKVKIRRSGNKAEQTLASTALEVTINKYVAPTT